jgi:hypothetical protein
MPSGRLVVTRNNAKGIRTMRAMFITPWYTALGVSGCPWVDSLSFGPEGKLSAALNGGEALSKPPYL